MTKSNLRLAMMIILFGVPFMALGVWWGLFPSALLAVLILKKTDRRQSFISGFIIGMAIWLVWSFTAYFSGGQIISPRVGEVFGVHFIILFFISSIIGGLLSGLGALSGTVIWPEKDIS